ncbi:MAG: hypothetical protein IJQ73_09060 [Kiritimatiellae bacterium]|nr:hypothetical protein [Kiritimatiellia bacterium]
MKTSHHSAFRILQPAFFLLCAATLSADPTVSKFAVNDQPVISGEGTATISRKAAGGTYAVLASDAALPWTDATGGLLEGTSYVYRVEVDGAATELPYLHAVRLERAWRDLSKLRPSVRPVGTPTASSYKDVGLIFNGDTADFYEDMSAPTLGVDFGRPVTATLIRLRPRSGLNGRLNGKVVYGANADDFADAVALGTCAIAGGWAEIEPAAQAPYRFYYVSPDYGNLSEFEVYGYGFGARVAGALADDVPVVDASFGGLANIYRDNVAVAAGVSLPWPDTSVTSPGKDYAYRVVSAADPALDFSTTYRHVVWLEREWSAPAQVRGEYAAIHLNSTASEVAEVFDNDPATWMEPGSMAGVDFVQRKIVTLARLCPRNGLQGRLDGAVLYGANAADYSAAAALATVSVATTKYSWRDFLIASPGAYRYYYVKKGSATNLAELMLFGYDEPLSAIDVSIARDDTARFDGRTLDAAILGKVNVYRDGVQIATNVALPWTDFDYLAPGRTYAYRVTLADDEDVMGDVSYRHIVRLERSWRDVTRLRAFVRPLGPQKFYNSALGPEDYLYDGDPATMYPRTCPDGLDFGAPVTVELVRAYRPAYPVRYNGTRIYGANAADFSDEVLLATVSNYTAVGWCETPVADAPACRYYRFDWAPDAGSNNANFPPAELQLFGLPGALALHFGATGTNDWPVVDAWYYGRVDIYRDGEKIAENVELPWTDSDPLLVAGATYRYRAVPQIAGDPVFEGDYRHAVRLERAWETPCQRRDGLALLGGYTPNLFDGNPWTKFERGTLAVRFPEPATVLHVAYASQDGSIPSRMSGLLLYGANSETDILSAENRAFLGPILHKIADGRGFADVENPGAYSYYAIVNTNDANIALSELEFFGFGAKWFAVQPANELDRPRLYGLGDLGRVDVLRDGAPAASGVTLPWEDAEARFEPGSRHVYTLRLADGTTLSANYEHWTRLERKWTTEAKLRHCSLISAEPTATSIFDGDTATYGYFTNAQAAITLDFGRPVLATAVRLLPYLLWPINAYVTVSGANAADFSDETALATAPFPTLDRGLAWTTFAIPEAKRGKFRYYRFHRQSWYGQIREIQLFGRPSAPGTCLFVR